ncbi:Uncharacterised protein [Vibrio cholerae]|nr:Uncharacterised protein [Vibrio cholerae]
MESNTIDHTYNIGDLLRGFVNRGHSHYHLLNQFSTAGGDFRGFTRKDVRLHGVIRVLSHRAV